MWNFYILSLTLLEYNHYLSPIIERISVVIVMTNRWPTTSTGFWPKTLSSSRLDNTYSLEDFLESADVMVVPYLSLLARWFTDWQTPRPSVYFPIYFSTLSNMTCMQFPIWFLPFAAIYWPTSSNKRICILHDETLVFHNRSIFCSANSY